MSDAGRLAPAALLSCTALSALGDYLAVTALALYVQQTSGSPITVSALMLAGLLPLVLFAPLAGAALDWFEARRLVAATLAAQAVLATGLAFAQQLWQILVLVFLLGTAGAVTQNGLLALLPGLAPAGRLAKVNGWFEAGRAAGVTLGPPLGGIVATAWGPQAALLADAATFAALCAALRLVPSRPPAVTKRAGRSGRDLTAGISHLVRHPRLRLALAVTTGVTFFLAGVNVAELFFATDTLRAGGAGYGLLVGMWGLGMVAGALAVGRWPPSGSPALMRLLAAAGIVAGVSVGVCGAIALFPVAVAGWALAGVANGVLNVTLRTLLHENVPVELHGRVFAAQYACYNAAKIAAMVTAGPVVVLLRPAGAVVAIGACTALVGVAGVLMNAIRTPRE
ncbi:Major Facilitator Superfamily protein [Nonomuraea solani]|uniref:Major Facilitator Superfamily protein n=1 Tax=Nonomuraea solani TaxID=1144553 RepID=A0A1H6EW24_9ACTN|nr:MFS transporter [Nonomuraea solani]SEH01049.1 Major Facilitator Superfamily protein [Nonomuraea solani]